MKNAAASKQVLRLPLLGNFPPAMRRMAVFTPPVHPSTRLVETLNLADFLEELPHCRKRSANQGFRSSRASFSKRLYCLALCFVVANG